MIEAARGDEDAREHALSAAAQARQMGAHFVEAQAYSMLGLLELGRGRSTDALKPLELCGELAVRLGLLELGHLQWAAELVEALARLGHADRARRTLQIMADCCHDGASHLTRALYERCRGLVESDEGERHFKTSLEVHASAPTRPFELARTQLCFGEHLRRRRRRREARLQLVDAWETFTQLGAATWAQRAAHELEATGIEAPGAAVRKSQLLTPQELQVALAVAGGATNREVADKLYLSQKTVEFHLSAIYRRLGIRSRSELTALESLTSQ
jgi:DNA-binding CsgD family transcriptional regulator